MLLAVAGDLTRRGKQTLLSITHLLAVASGWRANTALCRKVRFLTPKTQFSSTLIPKLIGNSTYDHSTV